MSCHRYASSRSRWWWLAGVFWLPFVPLVAIVGGIIVAIDWALRR